MSSLWIAAYPIACCSSLATSLIMGVTCRRCTRSKSPPSVHSSSKSSTTKRRLGGTQCGCIGERSVPITTAPGNLSATDLALGQRSARDLLLVGRACLRLPNFLSPFPDPQSFACCPRWVRKTAHRYGKHRNGQSVLRLVHPVLLISQQIFCSPRKYNSLGNLHMHSML